MSEKRKFYKSATAGVLGNGFGVFLDGRRLMTPAKKPLIVPNLASAELIATEWQNQGEFIDTNIMPITRLVNVAIDRASETRKELVAEMQKYASSDLCCYRTIAPHALYLKQCQYWDEHINWINAKFGVNFISKTNSLTLFQTQETLDKIGQIANNYDDLRLTILVFVTALAGSAILGLKLVENATNIDEIFNSIRIEEDYNAAIWGYDEDDLKKAQAKKSDLEAAFALINTL